MSDDGQSAGWLPDPFEPERLRYWDGARWTGHVAPIGAPAQPPGPIPDAQPDATPRPVSGDGFDWSSESDDIFLPADRGHSRRRRPLAAAVVLLLAIVGAGAFVALSGGEDQPNSSTTATPATEVAEVTTVAPAIVPSTTVPASTTPPSTDPSTTTSTTTTTTTTTSSTTTTTTVPPECNDLPDPLPDASFTDLGPLSAEASSAVAWGETIGLVSVGDGTFRPTDPMSRAEVITLLWRYFCRPTPGVGAGFTDVPAGAFYATAVDWAAETGTMNGTNSSEFSPDAPVSRAQFVTVVWRSVGSPTPAGPAPFTDTTPGSFYSAALDWTFEIGLVSGKSSTEFAPDDPLDRLTVAILFWRLETILDPAVT